MKASRSISVALGVALRGVRKLFKSPGKAASPMITPLLLFAAFTGALSALGGAKSFDYYNYTAFEFVFILYAAAMLVGVFTAFDIAFDYQSGMGNRLMLAAPQRMAIVSGYLIVAIGRAVVAIALVWATALATGMPVRGTALEIAGLIALALILNLAATLYGTGIALRFQSAAAGALILIPVYMVMLITPVFTPRDELNGWLQAAAGVNPLTAAMEAGRGFLADDPVSTGLAFAAAGALVIVFSVLALLGMKKAERGPGGGGGRRARRERAKSAGTSPAT
jgi:ABC-2 type transport system permease protein